MGLWLKIMLSTFSVLLLIVLIAAIWYLSKAVPIGTGYVAKYLCSSTYISLRDPKIVFVEDVKPVNPLAAFMKWRINAEEKSVTATAFGYTAKAVYRDGCGCTLLSDISENELAQQNLFSTSQSAPTTPRAADVEWPAGDGPAVDPALFGINGVEISKTLDYAFAEPTPKPTRRTRAILIAYDGHLIAERYAPGFTAATPILGWSMSKSITNALVGVLVHKGMLDIYEPAPVPEWRQPNDLRQNITLDQLLRMSSGLAFQEIYEPLYDATNMLYSARDFAAFAANKPLEHSPDSLWSYSSGTANMVARIVRERALELYDFYYDFLRFDFFAKIGMRSALIEPDPSGTFVGSSYCYATPRDWARFGQLYLQNGLWNGEQILPDGWVDYTTTPTPNAPMGEYGALFWLNAGAPGDASRRKWPAAPADMFVAQGGQEQRVMIIPSLKLVIVRFGASATRDAWDSNEFLAKLLPAFPVAEQK